ncbi:Uncharacterized [Moorella glycerini]|uniref:Uncharacterized protein n=1 Tax=Neomoorella stamsii TaxID=1266720 RepID=A0A9X7J5P5_9FIRM|nr:MULTISPECIES: hypothetical protein [Moorella]PRR75656.1 hypothetical protein MOST_08390 [Moorella stamsii]CEP66512.1 Uncharacterized [Moorella glycerini]
MGHELKDLWAKTDARVSSLEQEIVDTFINFLREVAKHYLQQGRLVYFRENTVVHYGEGGFGELTIEGNEDVCEVFGDYIYEVNFEPDVATLAQQGYTLITEANLESIRYVLR